MIEKPYLLTKPEEINQLYEFINKFPLDYSNYMSWVEKCFKELQFGYKKAFIIKNGNKIIANLIFQKDKIDSKILELKNGRVEPRYRRNKLFKILYKEVEKYAIKEGFKKIQCDTHSINKPVIQALSSLGFVIEAEENLYDNTLEVILSKNL